MGLELLFKQREVLYIHDYVVCSNFATEVSNRHIYYLLLRECFASRQAGVEVEKVDGRSELTLYVSAQF